MKKISAVLLVSFSLAQAEIKAPVATAEIDQKSVHARKLYYALKAGDNDFIQKVLKESNDSQEEQFKNMLAMVDQQSHHSFSWPKLWGAAAVGGATLGIINYIVFQVGQKMFRRSAQPDGNAV